MKKKFRKIISLCICLILISTAITPVFALSQKNTNKPSDNLTMLDVKTKYNPLRTNSENNYDLYEMEPGEFNDENVKFERVTYYDEFNNKIKEYTGEAALNHLYEIEKIQPSLTTSSEIMNMMNNQTLIKNEDDRFERRVIVSYIDSKATTKVIRKKPIKIGRAHV